MLGQSLAAGRDRRERNKDRDYDRKRQEMQDVLHKGLIESQLEGSKLRNKATGMEVSEHERLKGKRESLDKVRLDPMAYRPGDDPEVVASAQGDPDKIAHLAENPGEAYDFSKPPHQQSPTIKRLMEQKARELNLTPEEITSALSSRSQAMSGPFAPSTLPGMRITKATTGPDGQSVTQERDFGPMAVNPVRDTSGNVVPSMYSTPEGKIVTAPQNPTMEKFRASQAEQARALALEVQDLQQTQANIADIKQLVAAGAGGPMGGSGVGQLAARVAAAAGSPDAYNAQRVVEQFANKGIMDLTSKLKGPLSEKELAFLTKSVPTIADTPEVWARYLEQVEAAIQKAIQVKSGALPTSGLGPGPQATAPGAPAATPQPRKFQSMEEANAAAGSLSPGQQVEIRDPATGTYKPFVWKQ